MRTFYSPAEGIPLMERYTLAFTKTRTVLASLVWGVPRLARLASVVVFRFKSTFSVTVSEKERSLPLAFPGLAFIIHVSWLMRYSTFRYLQLFHSMLL